MSENSEVVKIADTAVEEWFRAFQEAWIQLTHWDHKKKGVSPTFLFFSPPLILIFFAYIAHCPECSAQFSVLIFGALAVHTFLKLTHNPVSTTIHYQVLYSCVLAFFLLSFSPSLPYEQTNILLAVLFPLYYHLLTGSILITLLISLPIFLVLLCSSLNDNFSSSTQMVILIVVPAIFWMRTRDKEQKPSDDHVLQKEEVRQDLENDPKSDVMNIPDSPIFQIPLEKKLEKQRSESSTDEYEKVILGISHDCRNLLNSLKSILTLMKDDSNEDDTYTVKDDNLQSAIAISEHLTLLLTNLLDYLKKNEDANIHGETKLTSTLEKIWLMTSPNLKKKNLGGSITIKNGTPVCVDLDERRFMGILLNIIGNAIKFTDTGHIKINVHWREENSSNPDNFKHESQDARANIPIPGETLKKPEFSPRPFEDNQVEADKENGKRNEFTNMVFSRTTFFDLKDIDSISFSKKCFTVINNPENMEENGKMAQGYLIVTVRDTGCGIDEDDLKKLFQKYRQVGEDVEKNKLGYGLGLWYTKYLLGKLSGKIDFRSTKDVGTWVKIEIPCKVVNKKPAVLRVIRSEIPANIRRNLKPSLSPNTPRISRVAIFLREDECLANLLVAEYLKKHGKKNVEVVEIKSTSEILRSDKLNDLGSVVILGESSANRQEVQSLRILLGLYRGRKLPLILLRDSNEDFNVGENGWGNIDMDFHVKKPMRKTQLDQLAKNIEASVGRKLFLEPVEKPKGVPHIMVVDDDGISRLCLQRQIEKNGFLCYVAKDGCEALETYKKEFENIKLIFMDSQMPKMNGLEATKAIRDYVDNTKLTIFGLTGIDSEEFREKAIKTGMNEVYLKPIPMDKLLQLIHSSLE